MFIWKDIGGSNVRPAKRQLDMYQFMDEQVVYAWVSITAISMKA